MIAKGYGDAHQLRKALSTQDWPKDEKVRVTDEQPAAIPTFYIGHDSSAVRINVAHLNQVLIATAQEHGLATTPLHSRTQIFRADSSQTGVDEIIPNASFVGAMYVNDRGIGTKLTLGGSARLGQSDGESETSNIWPEVVPVSDDEVVLLPRAGGRVQRGNLSIQSRLGQVGVPYADMDPSDYHPFLVTEWAGILANATQALHHRLLETLAST
jgi:hypothetical protein